MDGADLRPAAGRSRRLRQDDAKADIGAAASEFSGLSSAQDQAVVDQVAQATGTTTAAGTVASGATPATTAGNELAIGMYVDSGFSDTLTAGSASRSARRLWRFQHRPADRGPGAALCRRHAERHRWHRRKDALVDGHGCAPGAARASAVGSGPPRAYRRQRATAAPRSLAAARPTAAVRSPATRSRRTAARPRSPQPSAPRSGEQRDCRTLRTARPTHSRSARQMLSASALTRRPRTASSRPRGRAGQWSSLMNWPIVGIHSVLMNNGKLLEWDGWSQPEPTQVWDPSTQTFSHTINPPDSIFCSAIAQLPDGRILVAGATEPDHRTDRDHRHDDLRPGHVDLAACRRHALRRAGTRRLQSSPTVATS